LKLPYHTPKLAPRCQGPFHVHKVISPVAYQLTLPLSWGIHDVFHASLLLLYKETPAHGPNFTRPPPDLVENVEEYEVESVVNHRYHRRRHQLQYLIKWSGYPSSDNMWEAVEDVHADDLVKEYHQRHPLNSPKSRAGRGTKELIRALQLSIPFPSPIQKVKAWLLNGTHRTLPLHTPIALQSMSECLPSPPISPWWSMPFKSSRKRSTGLARRMLGNSYRGLHALYEQMSGADAGTRVLARKLSTVVLRNTLLRTAHQASSPKTPPCTTPPSGCGHPL